MSCSYSIYLIIMYFNPRIEAWLYKITNTNSPEYKSDLHASNGIKANSNGYQKIGDEEQSNSRGETEEKEQDEQDERKENGEEKQPLKGKVYNFVGNRNRPETGLKVSSWGLRDSCDG